MAKRIVKANRAPDWDKWRLIPEPRLWQCVALSMNIDPDKACIDCAINPIWGNCHGPRESPEFYTRLDIALGNLGRAREDPDRALRYTTPRFEILGMGSLLKHTVSLRQFAAWVEQIGWTAPEDLRAMADTVDANRERRTHNKRKLEARANEWQERINKLAQDSPGKSHADCCRALAKEL